MRVNGDDDWEEEEEEEKVMVRGISDRSPRKLTPQPEKIS